jgi:HD superfamily phosphohydrolase
MNDHIIETKHRFSELNENQEIMKQNQQNLIEDNASNKSELEKLQKLTEKFLDRLSNINEFARERFESTTHKLNCIEQDVLAEISNFKQQIAKLDERVI